MSPATTETGRPEACSFESTLRQALDFCGSLRYEPVSTRNNGRDIALLGGIGAVDAQATALKRVPTRSLRVVTTPMHCEMEDACGMTVLCDFAGWTENGAHMRTAVVLAGGLGSRLRPYTVVLPKPLMPIGDMPILEVILRQLKAHGFTKVVLAVNHQAKLIQAFFEDGERLGIEISYSLEERSLGTMGPLRLIDDLPENFIVMNGDVLADLNVSDFFERHEKRGGLFSISASEREQKVDYGVLDRSADGSLCGFREKPTTKYLVSMGIYAVNRRVVDWVPQNEPFGFDQLMLSMIAKGESVFVDPHRGYWLDIGRPDDYHQAIADWPKLKGELGL